MSVISVLYQVSCSAREIDRTSRDIALEQTVEVPEELVTSDEIRERVVGKVTAIMPQETAGVYSVTIEYQSDLASDQIPQLLNLIFGNVSIKNNVRVMDLHLPEDFVAGFPGPHYGADGIRALLGVYDRPLLATALKPRGATPEFLADLAGEFALGGGDIIKDDHNLVEGSFDAFKRRVGLCQEAVEQANASTGRNCLYFPNLCYPVESLQEYLDWTVRQGVRGILISPLVMGLDVVRHIAQRYPVVVMAHPTFAGTFFHDRRHGIEPGIMLGTLFRLVGADISVFPNCGGRFGFTRDECASIARRLTGPMGGMNAALPAPAGGMKLESIPQIAEQYGAQTVFLCGGALLAHGKKLSESTRLMREKVCEHFTERLTNPHTGMSSSCELPGAGVGPLPLRLHIPFQADFSWESRPVEVYKPSAELPFSGVARHELLGKAGEKAAFDVRYFEIAPGGFTSLEKHVHVHALIAVRGQGTLQVGDDRHQLQLFDVAYVPPMAVHQLRNESGNEPFGFFCIVDRDRDRPQAP